MDRFFVIGCSDGSILGVPEIRFVKNRPLRKKCPPEAVGIFIFWSSKTRFLEIFKKTLYLPMFDKNRCFFSFFEENRPLKFPKTPLFGKIEKVANFELLFWTPILASILDPSRFISRWFFYSDLFLFFLLASR